MAMTRQLWTINGLATELGKDRRTLGRVLRHVAADGTTRGGYKGWFMETALRALNRKGKAAVEDHLRHPDSRLSTGSRTRSIRLSSSC